MRRCSLFAFAAAGALAFLLAASAVYAQPAPATSSGSAPAAPPMQAAPPAAAAGEDIAEESSVAPDSPRAAVRDYLDLARAGRFEEAARYLDSPADADGARLAKQLKAVLDRRLWIDLELVSPQSAGDANDRLPPALDEIGKIPSPSGPPAPVRVVRRQTPEGARWMFSRRTVERVRAWYDDLRDRWLIENLPPALLRSGPKELLIWQWIALPLLIFAAIAVGRVLGWITYRVFSRLASRTSAAWDDTLLERLRRPFRALWALVTLTLALPWLSLYEPAEAFITKILRAAAFVAVFWGVLRGLDVLGGVFMNRWEKEKAPEAQGMRSIVAVGRSVAKILFVAIALIVVMSELGYEVASLVTGLGVGTIALALAAQKTVENLFGSVSIGVDKPFSVGDFVKIEDFVGTVELIGLRSTRVRTLDRTIITIPNGRLADMRVESFSPRDRIRLAFKIGLVYETTAGQMREVLTGLERLLREHPKIWPEDVTVRFESFGESSLNVEVMAWFETPSAEFHQIRQELLLSAMDVVEKAGTSFAFPTRTIHLAQDEKREPPPAEVTRSPVA
jgi:MscS family membrane protein